jgi:hypothetical protein
MRTDKFCFHCGSRLEYRLANLECTSCGASYSNVLISESEYTEDGYRVVEMGVCLDITVKTPVEPLEVQVPVSAVVPAYSGAQEEIPV